ncbi:MAG: hypothetical protein LUF25_01790 [Phascolarctobacterium sp.]|nr:hypothetical protein [Phascolarctobacterium sp.]
MGLTSFVFGKFLAFAGINLLFTGRGPFKEDEQEYTELEKEMFDYAFSLGGPVGRIASDIIACGLWMRDHFVYKLPATRPIELVEKLSGKARRYVSGEVDAEELVEPAANTLGLVLGIPSQINKFFFNAYDILFNGMELSLEGLFARRPRRER